MAEELAEERDGKRVALLSFHNSCNYGAALQAYGLQAALESLGVNAQYIDYVNDVRGDLYSTGFQVRGALKKGDLPRAAKMLVGAGLLAKRRKLFERFVGAHLKLTSRTYHSSDEARALDGTYDYFVVGSDQVWNPTHTGGDAAYLLDFVAEPERKLSYASSFGMSDIPGEYLEMYRTWLSQLGHIAVREEAGARIIEQQIGRSAEVVVDPVLLADADVWRRLRSEGSAKDEDYVFFYTNRKNQVGDFWKLGYPQEGLSSHILSSTVSLGDFAKAHTTVCVAMSPADFLQEISSARLVVTASFHCVAFSIIFHKPFVAFLTGDEGKDERIVNLLKLCQLESRIVTPGMSVADIDRPIDYGAVAERIEEARVRSLAYLCDALRLSS